MFTQKIYSSVLLIFLWRIHFTKTSNIHMNTKGEAYEVINFQIPKRLYIKALTSTPVLKSSATIVLPIHVAQEDQLDEGDLGNDEQIEIAVSTPSAVDEEAIIQTPASPVVTATAVADDVSQSPVTEASIDEDEPEQNVTGQVFRSPCSCADNECTCCTGTILERISMKACGKVAFVPEDFVFDVKMTVNGRTVIRRRVSASDPPPICFNPRRAPFVHVCLEISNIRIRNRNAFACLDIDADIGGFPVYSASFRCFGLGASGIQTGLKPKPVSSGPRPVSLFGNSNNDDGGSFLQNAVGGIFGGDGPFSRPSGGLFGGSGGGLFGGGSDNDGGPLEVIGDAVGDLFGREND